MPQHPSNTWPTAVEQVNVEDAVAFRIVRMARITRRHFRVMMKRMGLDLSQEQWFTLNKLRRQEGCAQNDLTDALFGDRPNVSRMLSRMEQTGWIHRQPCAQDGRVTRVYLTDEGRAVHDQLAEAVISARPRVFASLDDADLEALDRVFATLEKNLIADESSG